MRKHKSHVPIRTCISCKTRKEKEDLIRLVLNEKRQIVIDDSGRGKGRAIYSCNKSTCLKKLMAYKNLNRFFRSENPVTIGFDIFEN